jgi:tetratricopeptide (TPR) repeat protein
LEKGGEPAELLLDLYLKNGKWSEGTALALKIFSGDEKNFGATQKVTEALLEHGQGERAMSMLSRIRIPMIDAGEHEGVAHLLTELATRLPGRLEPLEWLVDTYGRTSDSFRLPDALANLGDGLVAAGKLDRAKETFEQLLEREPDSESAKRRLNDVLRKMGLMSPEAGPMVVPEQLGISESLLADIPKADGPKLRPDTGELTPEVAAQSAAGSPTEPQLDEETQKFIAQSLTDVDLFASYGLTQKAIGLLEAILRRAPMHTPTLEKLLDFVLGAGDDRRTAELAAHLEHIHADRGDTRSSERFGELRRRFQRAAGLTDDEIAAAVAAAMPQSVDAVPVEEVEVVEVEAAELPLPTVASVPQAVAQEPHIESAREANEVPAKAEAEAGGKQDLSSDWASLLEETKQPAEIKQSETPAPIAAPSVGASKQPVEEEIDLSEMFNQQAPVVPEVAHAFDPVAANNAVESLEFEVPVEAVHAEEEALLATDVPPDIPVDTPSEAPPVGSGNASKQAHRGTQEIHAAESLLPDEELTALPLPELSELAAEGPEPQLEVPQAALPGAAAREAEFELDQDFELILEPESVVPAHEMLSQIPLTPQAPASDAADKWHAAASQQEQGAARVNGKDFTSDQFLADLANEIDSLGLGEFAETKSISGPPAETPQELANVAGPANGELESGPLKEVFEEFRSELGEMGSDDEDLETHYNLGIAFREMGLLEEAIGEFQKVAKANDRGKAFRYAMQCCTLLGLAFMEKGQPAIAAIWYERALQTPGIDSESKLALRYDLGVAQESAGDLEAAVRSFSQVYAVNIDYRDVADRIAAHQKPAV